MRKAFLFGVVSSALLVGNACQQAKTEAAVAPVVRVMKVGDRMTNVGGRTVRYSGTIEPYARVDLAFRVGGYVAAIRQQRGSDGRMRALEPGDLVTRGTLLASLRAVDYRARVNQSAGMLAEAGAGEQQARAQLEQAEAQRKQAALDLERAQVLFRAGAMTKPDFDAAEARQRSSTAQTDAARAAIAMQSARVKQAEADKNTAQVSLEETELRAPFDAVVLSRSIELGTLAASGAPALALADVKLVKTAFGVPDVDLQNLRLGRKLPLRLDALPGKEFAGTVISISPIADGNSRMYNVQLRLDNPRLLLKPGMVAEISVADSGNKRAEANTVTVPLTALVRKGGSEHSYGVYKIATNGERALLRWQAIELGAIEGNRVNIARGIGVGDRIVRAGGSHLFDGQEVVVSE